MFLAPCQALGGIGVGREERRGYEGGRKVTGGRRKGEGKGGRKVTEGEGYGAGEGRKVLGIKQGEDCEQCGAAVAKEFFIRNTFALSLFLR